MNAVIVKDGDGNIYSLTIDGKEVNATVVDYNIDGVNPDEILKDRSGDEYITYPLYSGYYRP